MTSSTRGRRCAIRKPMASANAFKKPFCKGLIRSRSGARFIGLSKSYSVIWMTGCTTITTSARIRRRCAVGAHRCKHSLTETRRGTIKSPYSITELCLTAASIKSGNCQINSELLRYILVHAPKTRLLFTTRDVRFNFN